MTISAGGRSVSNLLLTFVPFPLVRELLLLHGSYHCDRQSERRFLVSVASESVDPRRTRRQGLCNRVRLAGILGMAAT